MVNWLDEYKEEKRRGEEENGKSSANAPRKSILKDLVILKNYSTYAAALTFIGLKMFQPKSLNFNVMLHKIVILLIQK